MVKPTLKILEQMLQDFKSVFNRFETLYINSFMTEVPIYSANQWTGFYKIRTSIMKEPEG